jgi:hypothetical protein
MVQMNEDSAADYLTFFGYLSQSGGDFREAVKLFQAQFGGLQVDGVIGPKTMRAMEAPRCGLPDSIEEAGTIRRWAPRDFTKDPIEVRVEEYLTSLPKEDQRAELIRGMEAWEKVCGIGFAFTSNASADITVSTGRGRGQNFDGLGNTLAWAELPSGQSDRKLMMRFDADEAWGKNGLYGRVFCHELGHAIGISHLNESEQLMNPFVSKITVPQKYDIAEGTKRYGKPIVQPGPSEPSPSGGYVIRVKDRNAISIDGHRILSVE